MMHHQLSFREIVNIDELKKLFEAFSTATGFTTGLVDKTANEILIATGWRDICVKFHRANPTSLEHCKSSGRILTDGLDAPGEIRIFHCQNGLVDGCTPIIIEGQHLANLATGQIFFAPPEIDRFKEQARRFGYDEQAYLDAISAVPIVKEETFKAMLTFLAGLATTIAQIGLANLQTQKDQRKQEKLQIQLHHAQKMEAIGMMAGGVAHDLNNILSGIISYPELILLKLPGTSELRGPIKAILDSGKRAATVVDDLLTVARGAATIREPHNINLLVHEYLDSPEHKIFASLYPRVLYTKQLDAKHPNISCSPIHIKKTVMNLMTNAAEALGNSGNIIVSTCNRVISKSVTVGQEVEPGNYLVLTVQDNGKGIEASDLDHIFEPFYTKKAMGRSGTGLGLAIVWNTVQDHNGQIFVRSSEKGTEFQLYFPVSEDEAIEQVENDQTQKLAGDHEHILVVDDDHQQLDIASQILLSMGYEVDSVCSGELAIKYVKDNPVDLIVLDMLMEPGINGYLTYKEILKRYPNQKAIIASGFSESADVKEALRLGAGGFIKKPYSMAQLGRLVKDVLSS